VLKHLPTIWHSRLACQKQSGLARHSWFANYLLKSKHVFWKHWGSWSRYRQYLSKDDESLANLTKRSTQLRVERKGRTKREDPSQSQKRNYPKPVTKRQRNKSCQDNQQLNFKTARLQHPFGEQGRTLKPACFLEVYDVAPKFEQLTQQTFKHTIQQSSYGWLSLQLNKKIVNKWMKWISILFTLGSTDLYLGVQIFWIFFWCFLFRWSLYVTLNTCGQHIVYVARHNGCSHTSCHEIVPCHPTKEQSCIFMLCLKIFEPTTCQYMDQEPTISLDSANDRVPIAYCI
jgi:hypothetical protein